MMNQWIHFYKGYVKIIFSGNEIERFLNLCASNHLILWNVSDSHTGFISIKDFKQLRHIARKTKTRIRIQNRYGFPFFIQRCKKRRLFFCGMILFGCILYWLSLHIWNINISGNQMYSTQTILESLKSQQIYHGMKKKEINTTLISSTLRQELPNILWVSVGIDGSRLLIEIKENTHQRNLIEKQTDYDLIASRDGLIESIITREGTPLVKAGDRVKKGDILVSGLIEIRNDSKEVVDSHYVIADADVVLFTSYAYYDQFSMNYNERIYLDQSQKRYYINWNPYYIELGIPKKNSKADYIRNVKFLYLTEHLQLPVTVGTIRILPYQIKKKTYTKEEAITLANKHLSFFLKNLSQKGVEIYRKDVKINTSERTCITNGRIWVKEQM